MSGCIHLSSTGISLTTCMCDKIRVGKSIYSAEWWTDYKLIHQRGNQAPDKMDTAMP